MLFLLKQQAAVQWRNIKDKFKIILLHPNVQKMTGCADYTKAVHDLCNWGEALVSSSIELAELLRETIQKKYTLDSKKHQMQRYDNYLVSLKSSQISRQQMTAAMSEQLQDVKIDLNNVLMSFCQVLSQGGMFRSW